MSKISFVDLAGSER